MSDDSNSESRQVCKSFADALADQNIRKMKQKAEEAEDHFLPSAI